MRFGASPPFPLGLAASRLPPSIRSGTDRPPARLPLSTRRRFTHSAACGDRGVEAMPARLRSRLLSSGATRVSARSAAIASVVRDVSGGPGPRTAAVPGRHRDPERCAPPVRGEGPAAARLRRATERPHPHRSPPRTRRQIGRRNPRRMRSILEARRRSRAPSRRRCVSTSNRDATGPRDRPGGHRSRPAPPRTAGSPRLPSPRNPPLNRSASRREVGGRRAGRRHSAGPSASQPRDGQGPNENWGGRHA